MWASFIPTSLGELLSLIIVACLLVWAVGAAISDWVQWRREWRKQQQREREMRRRMADAAWQASRRFINRNPWDQS